MANGKCTNIPPSIDEVKLVKEIPTLGDVEEKCEFVVIADGKSMLFRWKL